MEIMTIPTTPWASVPSYAPSFAGPADATVAARGGASCVFGTDGDAGVTTPSGAGLERHAFDLRNKDLRNKDISTKDIRPGSRAWSPPV